MRIGSRSFKFVIGAIFAGFFAFLASVHFAEISDASTSIGKLFSGPLRLCREFWGGFNAPPGKKAKYLDVQVNGNPVGSCYGETRAGDIVDIKVENSNQTLAKSASVL